LSLGRKPTCDVGPWHRRRVAVAPAALLAVI
jgi:hypothetical protein